MIENVRGWIINITTVIIFISFIEILMPNSAMKKYLNLVLGFVVMLIILNPIISILENKTYLEDEYFQVANSLDQKEYSFATNNIESVQKDQLLYLYKNKIENEIRGRLESRYDVVILDINIDIDDSNENTGEIRKVDLTLEKIRKDITNGEIPIVSINVSEEVDETYTVNDTVEISLKDNIKQEISQAYNIKDSNIIVN